MFNVTENISTLHRNSAIFHFMFDKEQLRQNSLFQSGMLHHHYRHHQPINVPTADWWVLTTANTAGPNGLTCLLKHGARDNKFLVTHPMTEQCCLASAIVRRAH
jgi:hypothetical protein